VKTGLPIGGVWVKRGGEFVRIVSGQTARELNRKMGLNCFTGGWEKQGAVLDKQYRGGSERRIIRNISAGEEDPHVGKQEGYVREEFQIAWEGIG